MTASAGPDGVLTYVPRWVHLTHSALSSFLALVVRLMGVRLNLPGQLALLLVVVAGVLATAADRARACRPTVRPDRALRHSPGGDGTDQQSVGAKRHLSVGADDHGREQPTARGLTHSTRPAGPHRRTSWRPAGPPAISTRQQPARRKITPSAESSEVRRWIGLSHAPRSAGSSPAPQR